MSYVAPTTLKKNSISTTIAAPGITAVATTIPIADASVAYDASGNLITAGWVINANKAIAQPPEEVTVSACSVAYGVGGPANLTVARAVDYDANTGGTAQGAAYAWPAGTIIQVNFSIGIYNALTAACNSLNTGKASTAHAATHLPSGTDPLSLYPITTTIYIDGNRIDTYTADGSISKPFKTISAAIAAATGNVGYCINIAPGTYSEASAVTFPNVPIVLYGNGAYVTFSGGVTIQNANYSRYDLFDTGNVTFSATGAGRIVVQGGSINGNITCNSLIDLKSVTLAAGVITVNSTATFLALGCTITSQIAGTGTAFIIDCRFTRADNSNAVITSTGGLCVVQGCIVTNTGSGGGISCAHGASSTPNFILNNIITVGSGAPVACGTAATVYGKNEISGGTNTGTGLTPMNSDYIGPSQVVLGSDATGDMYYRSTMAALTRLAVGGSNTVIHGGTTPAYSAVVEADITLADNTTNDATTTKHGLLQKVVAGASSGIMNFLGTKYGETVSSWRALFDATVPAMNGSAATGSADTAARRDHVHPSDTTRAAASAIPSAVSGDVITGTGSGIQDSGTLLSSLAPKASPTFTGTPSLPTGTTGVTQTARNNSAALATTAYVDTQTRIQLTANTTGYVNSSTGSDSGTTQAQWVNFIAFGTGFATINHALAFIAQYVDLCSFTLTIQLTSGQTISTSVNVAASFTGGGVVAIQGDPSINTQGAADNYVISVSSGNAITVNAPLVGTTLSIRGVKLAASAGHAISIAQSGRVTLNYIDFGTVSGNHVNAGVPSVYVSMVGTYWISGNAAIHWFAQFGSFINAYAATYTIGAGTTITTWMSLTTCAVCQWGAALFTNNGTVTNKYSVATGGCAISGSITLPGTNAGSGGTTSGGGFYT